MLEQRVRHAEPMTINKDNVQSVLTDLATTLEKKRWGCYQITPVDFELLKSRVQLKDLPYYRDRIAKERIANVVMYVLLLFAGSAIMGALSALI